MRFHTITFGMTCQLLFACIPSPPATEPHEAASVSPPMVVPPLRDAAWSPGPDLLPCDQLNRRGTTAQPVTNAAIPSSESVEFSTEDRVANASPATPESAIGIVRLTVNGFSCTGTLIDPNWVLTAAHCAFTPGADGYLVANSSANVHFGREKHSGGRDVPGKLFCHAKYAAGSLVNDLALVRLDRPERNERPVRIVASGAVPMSERPGSFFSVYGFGSTSYMPNSEGSGAKPVEAKILMTGPMQVDSLPNSCARGSASSDTTFCADTSSDMGPAALCHGDSGGPAFVADETSGRRQVGVNSFMKRPPKAELDVIINSADTPPWLKETLKSKAVCGIEGNMSGFVDLARYRAWIEGAIGTKLP